MKKLLADTYTSDGDFTRNVRSFRTVWKNYPYTPLPYTPYRLFFPDSPDNPYIIKRQKMINTITKMRRSNTEPTVFNNFNQVVKRVYIYREVLKTPLNPDVPQEMEVKDENS